MGFKGYEEIGWKEEGKKPGGVVLRRSDELSFQDWTLPYKTTDVSRDFVMVGQAHLNPPEVSATWTQEEDWSQPALAQTWFYSSDNGGP